MTEQEVLPNSITIRGSIAVEQLDDLWCASKVDHERPIIVDLRECTYLEPVAMLQLIALIAHRYSKGSGLEVRLPRSRAVRDAMRVWLFPDSLSQAVDVEGFDRLVSTEDHAFFGESSSKRFLVSNILPLQTFHSEQFKSIDEFLRRASEPATHFLLRMLGEWLGHEVARNLSSSVVTEAFRNAINHPASGLIQAGSSWTQRGKHSEPGPGTHSFFVWDNGDSIVTTLRRTIESGRQFDPDEYETLHRDFHVREFTGRLDQTATNIVSSRRGPTTSDSDAYVLLSAVFPGVGNGPGLGLYNLTNYVIDALGGTVSLRCDNLFLNLKRPNEYVLKPGSFPPLSAKLVTLPKEYGRIKGNLVTVRLPTSPPKTRRIEAT